MSIHELDTLQVADMTEDRLGPFIVKQGRSKDTGETRVAVTTLSGEPAAMYNPTHDVLDVSIPSTRPHIIKAINEWIASENERYFEAATRHMERDGWTLDQRASDGTHLFSRPSKLFHSPEVCELRSLDLVLGSHPNPAMSGGEWQQKNIVRAVGVIAAALIWTLIVAVIGYEMAVGPG